MFFNTENCNNNIGFSPLLSQAKSKCFARSVVSTGARFCQVLDFWAKPELEVFEVVGAGLGGCFAVRDIVEEDAVL